MSATFLRCCRREAFILLGLLPLVLSSCGGEKQVEIVKPFRPQYEAFQKQLAEFAAQEPKAAVRLAAPLEPKPLLKGYSTESNTAIFMLPQLTDIRAGLSTPIPLDLMLSGRVLTQLRVGTAPDAHLTGTPSKSLRDDLTYGLTPRYIGAVKVMTNKPGIISGSDSFTSGTIQAVIMLFDRQTNKLVYADMATAKNDSQIDAKVLKGKELDPKAAQAWVDSNLLQNYKKAVLAKFAEGTGGVFESGAP